MSNALSARLEAIAAQYRSANSLAVGLRALATLAEHVDLAAGVVAAANVADGLAVQAESLASTLDALTAWTEPLADPVHTEPIDLTRLLIFEGHHRSGSYEREQRKQIITGSKQLRFQMFDLRTGVTLALPLGEYTLTVDDAEHARITVTGGKVAFFTVAESAMQPGWRRVRVSSPGGLISPTWFVHVGTARVGDMVPVCTAAFDWTHGPAAGVAVHQWAWVRADAAPLQYPVKAREWPAFDAPLTGKDLALSTLMPDTGERRVNQDEIPSTFNIQSYYYYHMVAKEPPFPLLDGPAGVGTLSMATHIEMGVGRQTSDPASPLMRNVYVCTPWSVCRVGPDGHKKTLIGLSGWPGKWTLHGDWSAIPPERHGLHEAWPFRFDPDSVAQIDPNAPPGDDGRQPHAETTGYEGPTAFIADTQNNRILKAVFSRTSHSTPAKITEFITGLADPFGMVVWRDWLIISERLAHRIVAYDKRTGTFVGVIVQGEPSNYILGRDREPVRQKLAADETAALAVRRAVPTCVAPEGLEVMDDTLYFTGVAMAQVRRKSLLDLASPVVVQGNVPVDGGANFMGLAVSDGTFGPRGTAFVSTWSATSHGYPWAILPDGKRWTYMVTAQDAPIVGRGPLWGSLGGYPSAAGVGDGRMVIATSRPGLHQIGRALPIDVVVDPKRYAAGKKRLGVMHWIGGYSPLGHPLPWGQPDLDYYLQAHGHALP